MGLERLSILINIYFTICAGIRWCTASSFENLSNLACTNFSFLISVTTLSFSSYFPLLLPQQPILSLVCLLFPLQKWHATSTTTRLKQDRLFIGQSKSQKCSFQTPYSAIAENIGVRRKCSTTFYKCFMTKLLWFFFFFYLRGFWIYCASIWD